MPQLEKFYINIYLHAHCRQAITDEYEYSQPAALPTKTTPQHPIVYLV